MRKIWISYVAAVALLACASQAVVQATDAVKAAPAPSASAAPSKAATAKPPANAKKRKLVNLNAASREELKALPGGSDAEADRIIAGRPYNSKAALVTNNVISDGRYAMIRKLVVAGEPAAKSAKTAK
jgi:DNA uptake protein ComE-like DNA-binding protein